MKKITTTLLLVLAMNLHAQFSYHQAFTMGNSGYDSGQDVAVDNAGNVYVVGSFNAAFDADPGPGFTLLTPIGDDGFLAKYNDAGAMQWAQRFGGTGFDAGWDVEVQGTTVYVTGIFSSSDADFDPGPATATLTNHGGTDAFVARYGLDGSFISVLGVGGSEDDTSINIEVDGGGNFAITGSFESTDMDADPGSGTTTLATTSGLDVFLIKFSAAQVMLFGVAFGGGGNLDSDRALGLHMAATGDIYVTGSFSSTGGDFDPGPGVTTLNSAGSIDIFVSKFNPTGALQWAQRIGDTGGDLGYGLATDSNGDLYLCGYANSTTIDLDPGPNVENFSSGEGQDIVVVKLDPLGSYIWGLRIGGGSSDIAFEAVVDDEDHLFVAGNFGDANVDFDPGAGSAPLSSTSAFETDLFLAQFDTDGNFVDAFDAGNTGMDAIWSAACTPTGRLWVTGNTTGAVDADPGPGIALVDSLGSSDVFVGAYDHVHPVGLRELEEEQFTLYPNPARDRVTIDMRVQGSGMLELEDSEGRILLTQTVASFPLVLDLRMVPAGIHTLNFLQEGKRYTRKLLKVP
ncbi:MAG: SBBP repeat-containing protein [Flavobacteriales bacterium]